jgi:hypothetical protein
MGQFKPNGVGNSYPKDCNPNELALAATRKWGAEIMKKLIYWTAACAVFLSTGASATALTLTAIGKITYVAGFQDGLQTSLPAGSVANGDPFSLTITFNTDNAELDSFWQSDPALNIYSLPDAKASLIIGSFASSFTPNLKNSATALIANDWNFGSTIDGQLFRFNDNEAHPSHSPFDIGEGVISESIEFNAYDFTATARQNDLIDDLKPFSRFGNKYLQIYFGNSDTGLAVSLLGDVSEATLVPSAVPEPATWALMLGGFVLAGRAMRRSRRYQLCIDGGAAAHGGSQSTGHFYSSPKK